MPYNPHMIAFEYVKAQVRAGQPVDRAYVAELTGHTTARNNKLILDASNLARQEMAAEKRRASGRAAWEAGQSSASA